MGNLQVLLMYFLKRTEIYLILPVKTLYLCPLKYINDASDQMIMGMLYISQSLLATPIFISSRTYWEHGQWCVPGSK